MVLRSSSPVMSRRGREAGMSIVEVLIAAGLLLMIAIGILPLMTRSLASNVRGWEATVVSNESRGELERYLSGPFGGTDLDLAAAGAGNLLQRQESWTQGAINETGDADEGWQDGAPTDKGEILYQRDIKVRQFSLGTLQRTLVGTGQYGLDTYVVTQNDLETNSLTGAATIERVHVKQIEVQTQGLRQAGGLGAGQRMYIRLFKAF